MSVDGNLPLFHPNTHINSLSHTHTHTHTHTVKTFETAGYRKNSSWDFTFSTHTHCVVIIFKVSLSLSLSAASILSYFIYWSPTIPHRWKGIGRAGRGQRVRNIPCYSTERGGGDRRGDERSETVFWGDSLIARCLLLFCCVLFNYFLSSLDVIKGKRFPLRHVRAAESHVRN